MQWNGCYCFNFINWKMNENDLLQINEENGVWDLAHEPTNKIRVLLFVSHANECISVMNRLFFRHYCLRC